MIIKLAFQIQIQPYDEHTLRELKNDLSSYRECYNELRIGHEDVSNIPIEKIDKAFYEVSNRVNLKYAERRLSEKDSNVDEIDFTNLIIEFNARITYFSNPFTSEPLK